MGGFSAAESALSSRAVAGLSGSLLPSIAGLVASQLRPRLACGSELYDSKLKTPVSFSHTASTFFAVSALTGALSTS